MQTLIVILILIACGAYIVRRLWHRFSSAGGCGCEGGSDRCTESARCAGCPLADSCSSATARNTGRRRA